MAKLAPSILSADFTRLGRDIKAVEEAGADRLHFDVADGRFAHNITFGIPVIKGVRKLTGLEFEAHLMIESPRNFIEVFAEAGADIITVHLESERFDLGCLKLIKSQGKKAALALSPQTPISKAFPFLGDVSMVLVMSVEPGFGGQKFMPESLGKVSELANYAIKNGLELEIEIDGGINLVNARAALDAGAGVLVAGSAVFAGGIRTTKRNMIEFKKIMEGRGA